MTIQTTTYGGVGSFTGGLKKTIDDLFHRTWTKKTFEFEPVFKVEDIDEAWVDDVQIQLPSEIETVSEGGSYARVEIQSVRSKRYTFSTYKGEVKVTQEMLDDSKYKPLVDGAQALAIAARRTVEKRAAAFFYNGFTSEQSPDGVSVFNTAHTLADPEGTNPTTYSNRSTNTLTPANMKLRRSQMMKTRDEHGELSPAMPDQLIIGPDLIWTAEQMQESTLEPYTTDNQKNVAMRGLKVHQLTFLAMAPSNASTSWFLRDSEIAKNRFLWRMHPKSEVLREEATGDYLYRIMFRFAVGCSDWRGLDGNDGSV